jgi:hypothetical protein
MGLKHARTPQQKKNSAALGVGGCVAVVVYARPLELRSQPPALMGEGLYKRGCLAGGFPFSCRFFSQIPDPKSKPLICLARTAHVSVLCYFTWIATRWL